MIDRAWTASPFPLFSGLQAAEGSVKIPGTAAPHADGISHESCSLHTCVKDASSCVHQHRILDIFPLTAHVLVSLQKILSPPHTPAHLSVASSPSSALPTCEAVFMLCTQDRPRLNSGTLHRRKLTSRSSPPV